MARRDACGFEQGSLSEVDSVTDLASGGTHDVAISTLQARSGTRSLRVRRLGATSPGVVSATLLTPGTDPTSFAVRCSVFVVTANTGPGAGVYAVKLNFGLGESLSVEIEAVDGDVTFTLIHGTALTGNASADVIIVGGTNRWINICIRGTVNTGVGATESATMRVANEPEVSTVAQNYATAGLSSVELGAIATSNGDCEVFFDDLIVDDANANITDGRFLLYQEPVSDSGTQQWSTVGAGATHAARVSDADNATGVGEAGNVATQDDQYVTNDPPGTFPTGFTIPVVYVSVRDTLGSGSTQGVYQVADKGSDATIRRTGNITTSGVPTTRRSIAIYTTRPVGGSWTEADLIALELGLRYVSGQLATTSAEVDEMWSYAEVVSTVALTNNEGVTETLAVRNTLTLARNEGVVEGPPAVRATLSLARDEGVTEALSIINRLTLTRDEALAEEASKIIYLPGGTGGGGVCGQATLTAAARLTGSGRSETRATAAAAARVAAFAIGAVPPAGFGYGSSASTDVGAGSGASDAPASGGAGSSSESGAAGGSVE